jgi:O-antigen/teichoic acid export membrane protein
MLALSDSEERSRKIRGTTVIILLIASVAMILLVLSSYLYHIKKPYASLFLVSLPVCFYPLLLGYVNTVSQGDNHIGRMALARILPMAIYVPIAYLVYSNYGASASKMILLQWGIYTLIILVIILSVKMSFSRLTPIFSELNKENKDYGFQLYIGSLAMVASNYLAGITLGMFNSDNSEVGFYTLALTVTSPLATLPAIIGTTYFKQFAREPKIPAKVLKASIVLTGLSCILFILLIKPFVILLYSEKYSIVGNYAMWLSIGFCIHGFGDMINRYLGSHGQGKSIRNSSIANGVFKIFGFTVLVYIFGTKGALITNVVCSIIYCMMLVYYYQKFTYRYNV